MLSNFMIVKKENYLVTKKKRIAFLNLLFLHRFQQLVTNHMIS